MYCQRSKITPIWLPCFTPSVENRHSEIYKIVGLAFMPILILYNFWSTSLGRFLWQWRSGLVCRVLAQVHTSNFTWKNNCKIELEDHDEFSAYWHWILTILKLKHLNTKHFEVWYSNGQSNAMSYVLDQPFEYWTSTYENKMAYICQVFKWLSIWHPTYMQWGSEYQAFEYTTFRSWDFKWFGIQMVKVCAISYVLDRPFKHQTST